MSDAFTVMYPGPDGPDAYNITYHEHGAAIAGKIPGRDFLRLLDDFKRRGFTIFDIELTQLLSVDFVVTSPEGADAWRALLESLS